MKKFFGLGAAGALLLFACTSSEKETGPSPSELAGRWSLDSLAVSGTVIIRVTADSTAAVDTVLRDTGCYLDLRAGGTFAFSPPPFDFVYDAVPIAFLPADSGTWSLSGRALTLAGEARETRCTVDVDAGILDAACAVDSVIHWTWNGASLFADLDAAFTAARR